MACESKENYLETILVLQERLNSVRSIDIVNELGFSKPSVSIAMKSLKEQGYIDIENGKIILTKKGNDVACHVYEKHKVLTEAFIKMGVDSKIAEEDACKIEHIISEETFKKIKDHLNRSK